MRIEFSSITDADTKTDNQIIFYNPGTRNNDAK
jgi:hypothetical protein